MQVKLKERGKSHMVLGSSLGLAWQEEVGQRHGRRKLAQDQSGLRGTVRATGSPREILSR